MLNYIFSNNLISDYSGWILYSFPSNPCASRQRQEVGRIDALEAVLVE